MIYDKLLHVDWTFLKSIHDVNIALDSSSFVYHVFNDFISRTSVALTFCLVPQRHSLKTRLKYKTDAYRVLRAEIKTEIVCEYQKYVKDVENTIKHDSGGILTAKDERREIQVCFVNTL